MTLAPYVVSVFILVLLSIMFTVFNTAAHPQLRWIWRALAVASLAFACLLGLACLVFAVRELFA